jgi:hypothetical protein
MKAPRVRPNSPLPLGSKVITADRGGQQGLQKNIASAYNEGSVFAPIRRNMNKDMLAMARRNYGYGRWEAPYWFIGPEQGMGPHEKGLDRRLKAWQDLGSRELNDCRAFHCRIHEIRWHCKKPKVQLKRTWRPLMLSMMTFLPNGKADNESLRIYQRDRWGALDEELGETCVIELSGLAAPNAKEAKDTTLFLSERIEYMRNKIRNHRPKLVVMYGREQWNSWKAIANAVPGCESLSDDSAPGQLPKTSILTDKTTILVCTPHPSRPIWDGTKYLGNEYWIRLGNNLRDLTYTVNNCLTRRTPTT